MFIYVLENSPWYNNKRLTHVGFINYDVFDFKNNNNTNHRRTDYLLKVHIVDCSVR